MEIYHAFLAHQVANLGRKPESLYITNNNAQAVSDQSVHMLKEITFQQFLDWDNLQIPDDANKTDFEAFLHHSFKWERKS
jgi:hypothetical protein